MCDKTAGFFHVLSVSVVSSVSVESAMERQLRVGSVFLRCVFERHTSKSTGSFLGVRTPSLMPLGPDELLILDPSLVSVVLSLSLSLQRAILSQTA